jgi:hypothetical protein
MRAGNLKLAVLASLGALSLLSPASADPSDDLAGPSAGTSRGGGRTETTPETKNIEIVDPTLEPKIGVASIDWHVSSNNLLSVIAGLKNKTASPLSIEIETIYKDDAGNVINTGSWLRFTLAPHELQNYRSSAITEGATDFLIRVRRARGTH